MHSKLSSAISSSLNILCSFRTLHGRIFPTVPYFTNSGLPPLLQGVTPTQYSQNALYSPTKAEFTSHTKSNLSPDSRRALIQAGTETVNPQGPAPYVAHSNLPTKFLWMHKFMNSITFTFPTHNFCSNINTPPPQINIPLSPISWILTKNSS